MLATRLIMNKWGPVRDDMIASPTSGGVASAGG